MTMNYRSELPGFFVLSFGIVGFVVVLLSL